MTTRINRDNASSASSSSLVPALGETWGHSANMRIILSWKNNRRVASIVKSSYMPDCSVYYKINVNIVILNISISNRFYFCNLIGDGF